MSQVLIVICFAVLTGYVRHCFLQIKEQKQEIDAISHKVLWLINQEVEKNGKS